MFIIIILLNKILNFNHNVILYSIKISKILIHNESKWNYCVFVTCSFKIIISDDSHGGRTPCPNLEFFIQYNQQIHCTDTKRVKTRTGSWAGHHRWFRHGFARICRCSDGHLMILTLHNRDSKTQICTWNRTIADKTRRCNRHL